MRRKLGAFVRRYREGEMELVDVRAGVMAWRWVMLACGYVQFAVTDF